MNLKVHQKKLFTCPFEVFSYKRTPFRLRNAPATFQCRMQSILSYMIEKCIKVFMDDFSVFGHSFVTYLHNLDVVLKRCVETNKV